MWRMADGVRPELLQGTEQQALLHQHFLSGRFTRRFPTSDSSGIPRVLSLAAVSWGRLRLSPVQEACAHLQPPTLQCQAENNLSEREVPECPVPAAAAELRWGNKVSQGMLCPMPAVSCSSSTRAWPVFFLMEAVSALLWDIFIYLYSACLLCPGIVQCFPLILLILELAIQGKHQSSKSIISLDTGTNLFICLLSAEPFCQC